MSQVLAIARRLEEAERTIAELRRVDETKRPPVSDRRRRKLQTSQKDVAGPTTPCSTSALATTSAEAWSEETVAPEYTEAGSPSAEIMLPDLSLDREGNICFYGPTSAVHDPPALDSPASQATTYSSRESKSKAGAYLTARAKDSQDWETFALKQAALQSDIPFPVIEKLLTIHWTWIAPMFMWVYRPAFIREFPSRHSL